MAPLTFQIKIVSKTVKALASSLVGVDILVDVEDDQQTFDELQARIAKLIEFLERDLKRDLFDGKEDEEVEFQNVKRTGLSLVNDMLLPNFYFHVVTTYAILRMKGVDLGKADYLGL